MCQECQQKVFQTDISPYGDIWVSIGSANGLVPDGTKPLPESMLTSHWEYGIHMSNFTASN